MRDWQGRLRSRAVAAPIGGALLTLALAASTLAQVRAQTPRPSPAAERGAYYLGTVTFVGNTRTRETVLRRLLGISEGELFDLSRVRAGVARLTTVVDIAGEESIVVDADPATHLVDVEITVEERDVFYPEGGGGYSQVDGWSGRLSFRARNAFGRGETLGISYRDGQQQTSLRLGASLTGVLGGRYDTALQLFDDDLVFPFPEGDALRRQRGVQLQLQRRIGGRGIARAAYTGTALEDGASGGASIPLDESAIDLNYSWDSHDDVFSPERGRRLRVGVEASGGPLGGDVSAIVPRLDLALTQPVTRSRSFSTLLRGHFGTGWVEPLDTLVDPDTGRSRPSISPLDLYFLGGTESLRGFGYRSVWLRDEETGLSLRDEAGVVRGGNGFFSLNLEYHLVPPGPVRVVLFADAGQVYAPDTGLQLGGTRISGGVELQLRVPGVDFPLRLIWAENLHPYSGLPEDDRERFERFSFGFGISF